MSHPFADLDPDRLAQRLAGCVLGRPLRYFASIESTNLYLRSLAPAEAVHGLLAVAEHQSAGRGKLDRRWGDAPGRSLLFSLLLHAGRPPAAWPLLTLAAAAGICRTLRRGGLADARLRWPNDVLIGERKVCGILTECAAAPAQLVIGIGINVHQTREEFPPGLRATATSLRIAGGRAWDRTDLLVECLEDFGAFFDLWQRAEDEAIRAGCRRVLATLGRLVRVRSHTRTVEGVMMDLDRDGSLVLREPTGVVSRWHSAEVEETSWGE